MDLDRWKQIDKLLQEALDLPSSEQDAFVREACAGDGALEQEVRSLLSARQKAGSFLDNPAIEMAPTMAGESAALTVSAVDSLSGLTIAHYRILDRLGSGGMGDVYLADDQRLKRRVALKFPKTAGGVVLREAQLAARLDHPNICQVYEAGEHEGRFYIAMQYVEGETLANRLRNGRLTETEAIAIAKQAAEGLAEAHRRGVLHRDIKPANIMLGSRGQVKVMDFGLAVRNSGPASEASITQTVDMTSGHVAGTLPYMSPEQLRGEPLDARADIFSFGAVLYEMFTGRRAFPGGRQQELMAAILGTDPPLTEVPPRQRALIDNCLAKSREARPASMQEVMAGLAAGDRVAAAPAKRRWTLGIAAAVLAALATVAWMQFAPSAAIHSLAILGLENLSGDPSQDYFADGLTNALAAGLGRLNGLRVIPPAATQIYRGMKKPLAEIGQELNADVLLEGLVARAGSRVEISTRLVNSRGGRDLWQHTYKSAPSDLPAAQNQIERDIAAQVHASAPDRARMIDTRKLDPRAYDLYLRGSYHLSRPTAKDVDQAIALYEQAVAIAPDFAPLQANLASAYANKSFSFAPDDHESEERAFAAIYKAFTLDPDSAEAHLARGRLLWRPSHGFPHRIALAEFRLAAAARPNLGDAWSEIASVLIHIGHLDEALVELRKAEALNPGQTSASGRESEVFLFQGKAQKSLDQGDRPQSGVLIPIEVFNRAWAQIELGRFDDAARSISTGFDDSKPGAAGLKHAVSALLAARQGNRRVAESEIRAALAEPQGFGQYHHITFMVACAYSVLGDADRAQEWMEKSAAGGFPCFTLFEVEPSLETWRATAKGHEFLVKLRREWEATP